MQKIRIKKTPKPGDQLDYGLVGRNVMFTGEGEGSSEVKNTMTATSKDKANIEVEGGETVVGDINKDGFLEQFTFVGKKHSQGGMPVNIPEGSFIFSDTKKLKIKDKELLESIFGLKEKKGGYTPAEIAKRYQINQYVADLKSEDTDAIQKRSAAEMLKKNTEKLGMLALVQESMKGFPDGVPAIAESVMAGLDQSQIPGMEKGEGVAHEVMEGSEENEGMKCGGTMKKMQDGGFNLTYTPQTTIYVNGVPFKYDSHYDADFWGTGDIVTFKSADGRYYKTNSKDLIDRIDSGKVVDLGYKNDRVNKAYITSTPGKSYYDANQNTVGGKTFKVGTQFYLNGKLYKVEDPYASYSGYSQGTVNSSPTTMAPTTSGGGPYNAPGVKVVEIGTDGKVKGSSIVLKDTQIRSGVSNNTFDYYKYASGNANQQNQQNTQVNAYGAPINKPAATTTTTTKPAATTTKPAATGQKPVQQQTTRKQPIQNVNGKSDSEIFNSFEEGGSVLEQYQDGGPQQTQPGTLNTTVGNQQQAQAAGNQRVDPNKEIFVGSITNDKGEVRNLYYKGATKLMKDASGNIIMQGPRTDTQFEQYGSTNINKILASSPNVLYTETNFGSFANQPNVKGTGIYLSSGNAAARQSGDLSKEEWADFQKRHGDWIDAQYQGGFAQFQKDLRTGKVTGDKAAAWFQDAVNEKSMKQFGVPYFTALGQGKKEDNPYYRDSKFGQVTYSVPRFFDAPKPPQETPGQEVYYYCVEYTDGTKNVQSVTVEKGKTPTPPSGGNIKTVTGGSADKNAVDGQCINASTKQFEPQPKKEGPWWLQDIVNYVGTVTDKVNRYEPVQGKVDFTTPGYDLLDPTRKLAANQEQMARYQSQVENTADGNVGLATTLGASGEGFANAANVLDTTEAANIGIVNQAYDKTAQIQNQEVLANENARNKYVADMATMNQQYDNALQQKKWREIAAFNNGTTNWFRKKQMENVLFPQVYIDPILGDVDFSGKGRQLFGDNGTTMAPDVYQNPMYAGSKGASNPGYNPTAVNNMVAKSWQDAYNTYLPIMGEEQAKAMASKAAQSQMTAVQASQNPGSWQQNFMNAYNSGMTTPGAFNATPWDE
jgi:hypothetical protein